jgi:hypothetical protein
MAHFELNSLLANSDIWCELCKTAVPFRHIISRPDKHATASGQKASLLLNQRFHYSLFAFCLTEQKKIIQGKVGYSQARNGRAVSLYRFCFQVSTSNNDEV